MQTNLFRMQQCTEEGLDRGKGSWLWQNHHQIFAISMFINYYKIWKINALNP